MIGERLRGLQHAPEIIEDRLIRRVRSKKSFHIRAAEDVIAIDEDIEPQLDLVLADRPVRVREGTYSLLQADEFRRCLGGGPYHVVFGDFPKCLLPLENQVRNI